MSVKNEMNYTIFTFNEVAAEKYFKTNSIVRTVFHGRGIGMFRAKLDENDLLAMKLLFEFTFSKIKTRFPDQISN